ncbi:MAG: sodium:calcium antiporter [Candidatus Marinimicrobia bacterium]|nr:sodium:calcium antiporter [Candidatus Neomarinimicrobiota bacterium]
MWLYFLIFVLGLVVLARSSSLVVGSLTGLARFFKISEYVVAFLFMSAATSMPELFIGLSSAVKGLSEFSLGNILGANLINITLVIGIVIFLGKGLQMGSKISRRNFWIISGLSFLPIFLASDGLVSRGDGIVLLLAFWFYILRLRKEREYFTKTINNVNTKKVFNMSVFKNFFHFFSGVGLLILSSYAIVWAGQNLASGINLSVLSFSIIFVAIGTTLPELAFGIRARMMHHGSMAIGNSLGSVAFNSTLIIGLVSLVNPIEITVSVSLIVVALFLFLGLFLFNFFVYSKSLISRKEGLVLLLVYALFLIVQLFI